jgi:hypothetical protein
MIMTIMMMMMMTLYDCIAAGGMRIGREYLEETRLSTTLSTTNST